ncbi:MAG: hypothetical protein E2O39_14735 [Planctomycetota bacterium]|nr:MAG: hypothetical protein E2O39_14735 [Planctomycetota bacterium]
MAVRSRQDSPSTWHHVVQRAIARRPLFEDRVDIRFFLSRPVREVHEGRLEIHAWCVLTTHFHSLVRSPMGELAEAMRQAQHESSRFFNRRHRRDGSLIRGRFLSMPVKSLTYRCTLVRYIDFSAVEAGRVSAPWREPWGSAAQCVGGTGPRRLERSRVEDEVTSIAGPGAFRAADRGWSPCDSGWRIPVFPP